MEISRHSHSIPTRMGSHSGVYTRNHVRKLWNLGLEYGGTKLLGGFPSGQCNWAIRLCSGRVEVRCSQK